jgi:glycosyltransferase involved in cell wall biosynthesis
MTIDQPLVSVVTPFYNSAAYLPECIESVLGQTYPNFEYVLVDNCSTDSSAEIAKRYADADGRIRLLHNQEFLTQVQNYNHGLSQISLTARYCKMVQADDALFARCLADMVELAEAHPTVGVVSSYRMRGRHVHPRGLPHTTTFLTGPEACRVVLIDDIYLFGSPTTLLYRADLVRERNPFFTEGRLFEDTDVVYELLRQHDFGFVHQVLSYSRLQDDSILGRVESYNPFLLSPLLQLRLYGHEYLTDAEYAARAKVLDARYYRYLGQALLRRREPEFWDFHRRALATAQAGIDRGALVRGTVGAALDWLLSPEVVARALVRRLRKSRDEPGLERSGPLAD